MQNDFSLKLAVIICASTTGLFFFIALHLSKKLDYWRSRAKYYEDELDRQILETDFWKGQSKESLDLLKKIKSVPIVGGFSSILSMVDQYFKKYTI